jgi:tetratricopeptide (TPR) repeat protein
MTRKSASDEGRSLWLAEHGRQRDAERLLTLAAENDPLSPDPARELAQLVFAQWQKSQQHEGLLDRAISLQKVALRLDPHHYKSYWTLGKWYGLKHLIGQKPQDLNLSLAAYEGAVERYPHNAELLEDYARILKQAGRFAQAKDVRSARWTRTI